MAISLVGAGAPFVATTTTTTSFPVAYPTGVQLGDLLLMLCVSSVTAVPSTPTGWAVFEPNLAIGNPGPSATTFFRVADSTDVNTSSVTVTGSSGKWEAEMIALRGVDPTNPKDVTTPAGTQSASSTLAVPPTITTVTPGALVVLFAAGNSVSGVTTATWSSTNMTVAAQGTAAASGTNPNSAIMTAPMTTPGTFSPAAAVTNSGRSSMLTVALRPASSTASPVPVVGAVRFGPTNVAAGGSASIAVPAGVTTSHLGVLLIATNTVGSLTLTGPAGWTQRVAHPSGEGNHEIFVFTRLGGQQAGDTITVSGLSAARSPFTYEVLWYDTQGRDIAVGSTFGRAGTSQATNVIPGVTTAYAAADVLVLSTERTTADGTTITGWSPAAPTQDLYFEDATGTDSSFYFGHLAGPTPAGPTGSYTVTYSGASGNGFGVMLPIAAPPTPRGMGFNWPNAVVTYVNGWDQQTTTYANRARPFQVAKANGVKVMRTFFGTDVSFSKTRDPATSAAAWAALKELLDTAAANNVQLVLSNYFTQAAIEALTGTTYASWAAAQAALMTNGSPAWIAFQAWIDACMTRFASHPGVFSFEVANEPNYMLGLDSGAVPVDTGVAFLDTFQARYKAAGVKTNAGGRVLYNKAQVTDAQAVIATRNLDYLDDHFYPDHDTAANHLASMDTWVARINTLLGRTPLVLVGEYGTDPEVDFFVPLTNGAESRGWLPLAWGYDAYDIHEFNETDEPYVLAKLAAVNAAVPAVSIVLDRWDGTQLVRQRLDRWDGSALVQQVVGA